MKSSSVCHLAFSILQVYNLGTGQGYSVMDMINALSKAAGKPVSIMGDHSLLQDYNLDTGQDYSVIDMINALSKAAGKSGKYKGRSLFITGLLPGYRTRFLCHGYDKCFK